MGTVVKAGYLTTTGDPVGTDIPVTGIGFTPKVVIFFWSGKEGFGTNTGTLAGVGMGFMNDAGEQGSAAWSVHGTSGIYTYSRSTLSHCVLLVNWQIGTVIGALGYVSMDADGFTVEIDNAMPSEFNLGSVGYMAIGGDSIISSKIGSFTTAGSTGNQSVTGLGIQPDMLFFVNTANPIDSGAANASIAYGLTDGMNEYVFAKGARSHATASNSRGYDFKGEVQASLDPQSLDSRSSFVSFDSGGFTIYRNETSDTEDVVYLAIKGGEWHLYDDLTQTNVATDIQKSGFGFAPSGGIVMSGNQAFSSQDTVNGAHQFSIGAFNALDSRVVAASNISVSGPSSDSIGLFSDIAVYENVTVASGSVGRADIQSIDAGGFTFIMDDADPSQAPMVVLAIGPLEISDDSQIFWW
ncbi:MAG: hypothetical protein O3B43_06480 [Chloroflexi bacterium]|nr:hypothetical protein [Chloroflexota bacterium]